jgi:hypothetical protein
VKARVGLVLLALALVAVGSAAAAGSSATLPQGFVTWDSAGGSLKVVVGCALSSGTCSGFLGVYTPDGSTNLTGSDYSAPAGGQQTVNMDPGGAASKQLDKLDSVLVRVQPSMGQGDALEQTLSVVRKSSSGGGGGGGGGGGSGGKHNCTRCHRFFEFFSGVEKNIAVFQGHLFTKNPGTARCVKHKLVEIQKKLGGHWVTVGRTHTGSAKRGHPGYSAAIVPKTLTWDHVHLFRAVSPKLKVGKLTCLKAVSFARHAGQ